MPATPAVILVEFNAGAESTTASGSTDGTARSAVIQIGLEIGAGFTAATLTGAAGILAGTAMIEVVLEERRADTTGVATSLADVGIARNPTIATMLWVTDNVTAPAVATELVALSVAGSAARPAVLVALKVDARAGAAPGSRSPRRARKVAKAAVVDVSEKVAAEGTAERVFGSACACHCARFWEGAVRATEERAHRELLRAVHQAVPSNLMGLDCRGRAARRWETRMQALCACEGCQKAEENDNERVGKHCLRSWRAGVVGDQRA